MALRTRFRGRMTFRERSVGDCSQLAVGRVQQHKLQEISAMFVFKKALFGVAAAAVLSTLVFGRDALSYVKTFGCSARDAIKSEVPIEFEIQRARDMVGTSDLIASRAEQPNVLT